PARYCRSGNARTAQNSVGADSPSPQRSRRPCRAGSDDAGAASRPAGPMSGAPSAIAETRSRPGRRDTRSGAGLFFDGGPAIALPVRDRRLITLQRPPLRLLTAPSARGEDATHVRRVIVNTELTRDRRPHHARDGRERVSALQQPHRPSPPPLQLHRRPLRPHAAAYTTAAVALHYLRNAQIAPLMAA